MFRENFIDWSHLISEIGIIMRLKCFSINYACAHAQKRFFTLFKTYGARVTYQHYKNVQFNYL